MPDFWTYLYESEAHMCNLLTRSTVVFSYVCNSSENFPEYNQIGQAIIRDHNCRKKKDPLTQVIYPQNTVSMVDL